MKSSNHCIEAIKKAQKLLGYIKRQFRTRNKETILTLYNALVRPHLEYAVQFWSPSLRKDIERLEAVQARATKLIPSIRHLGYVGRLERLNLYSLEKRRLRGQLIETFKMLKGINNIDYRHLFTFSNNRTRSNGWKLELKRFNLLRVTPGVRGRFRTVTTSGRLGRFSSITFFSFFFLAVITLMMVYMLLFVFFFVLIMFLLLTVRIK